MSRRLAGLGTDGFGRSDTRAAQCDFFDVDARFITLATLTELLGENQTKPAVLRNAVKELDIDLEKPNPTI